MAEIFQRIFGVEKPFIGMVHIRPTIGYPDHPGIDVLLKRAVADAIALQKGGAHGILVENDRDQPPTIRVTEEQKNCIEDAVRAVRSTVSLPVGVNVLLNDWKASLDIAKTCGCPFVRIDVFVDRVSCPAGVIEPAAEEIIAYRNQIGTNTVAVFADIQVKHKTMLDPQKPLTTSAQQAINAGADALVVTGKTTGEETPLDRLAEVKRAFPTFPLLVGAGITAENVVEQFGVSDGAFVGTSLKNPDDSVNPEKVRRIVQRLATLV